MRVAEMADAKAPTAFSAAVESRGSDTGTKRVIIDPDAEPPRRDWPRLLSCQPRDG
ncbi:MAG TPA: hypothetical protein VGR16_05945 [Thermomicrobiales bacterium]|nr:hypothetical protein [Thermomicrobiales bacterium]